MNENLCAIKEITNELYEEYRRLNGWSHYFEGKLSDKFSPEEELKILIGDMEYYDNEVYKYMYEEPLNDRLKELIQKGKELLR